MPLNSKPSMPDSRRLLDVMVSLPALIVLLPLFAVIALSILLDNGRPIFFSQERVGRGGRRFRILKFRSMTTSAPEQAGNLITVAGDARVTRVGALLRKLKLDETPQFLNVLKGDMSLCGPRPEVPAYVDMSDPLWRAILRERPGITDPASLLYRSEEDVLARSPNPERFYRETVLPEKLRISRRYLETRSLWSDARLLFLTARSSLYVRRHVMESSLKVPYHVPSIGEEEIQEVVATLRSGWLTTGPRTQQFEEELAAYVGAPRAVALNSATAGLHLALAALEIGPGDEVITTPLTFCATVNTILQVGAKPVLADVGADGNISVNEIARLINDRTKAIVPVHLAGLPCNMDAIWALARQHGLFVIEDAAHAIGARYHDVPIGASGPDPKHRSDAVVFSFYATKNLTTGEGGMVTTSRDGLADTIRMLSLHGISKSAWNRYGAAGRWYYEVLACGFKYNLTDIQSAIGIHQLRKLDRFIEQRTEYARIYQEAFSDMAELETPPDDERCRHAWHLYVLRLNPDRLGIDRNEFIQGLTQKGIGSSVHFIPIPLHPYYVNRTDLGSSKCPRAMDLYRRIVSLPLYPAMTMEQVQYVVSSVKDIVYRAKRRKAA